MPNTIATRSAYLQLREERTGMREGYRFLDEQRLILAGELLQELAVCDTLQGSFEQLYRKTMERELREIDSSLEEQDREEAIRVRHFTAGIDQ